MAEVGSLQVDLTLSAAEFKRGIQDVNNRLKIARSEFKLAGAGVQDFGKSLDGMKSKSRYLEQSLQLQQSKVQQLRQRYEQLKATKGEDDAATQRMLIGYNNAQAAMNRTASDLERVNQQIRLQSSAWHQLGERLQSAGTTLRNVGQSMKDVGSQLSMRVTAPIVGLGTAAVKAGADFEEGMDKVAAVSGATGEDFTKLRELAKKLGAETKFSATEAAAGMQFLAMAGFKTNDILASMPGMLDLAAAGALELGAAADITSNIMSGFGIEASKAGHISDVLAKATANANTDVSQMGEAMKYLAPAAKVLGWSMEESAAAVMAFGDAGIQGTLAGQAFATSLTRLAKNPTKKMKKALDDLNFSFFDAQGTMKSMPEIIAGMEKGMAGWTDKQKAATITTIFGAEAFKHWAVLLDKGSVALGKNTKMLETADGAAAQMAKTMSDNTKGGIKTLLSSLEGLAIQLSDILLPIVNNMVQELTEWTRSFAALSPETQKTILAVAGIAAAIGPLLVILGTLVSSLGAIMTAFGTVSSAIAVVTTGAAAATPGVAALASAFTLLTGPVGIAAAAIAGLTIAGVALYKHLQKDAIPEVERFGEGVSKSTQKALTAYFELSDGASQKIKELSLTQQAVTIETKDALVNTYGQMNEQILAKMDERHTKQLEKMQSFFLNSSVLTATEEEKILQEQQVRNQAEISGQEFKELRIKEILEKASAEKRALTQSEQQEINNLQKQMNENAVQFLSKNELESKIIMEKMRQTAGDLSARQAAEVVKNSNKQKNEAVKAAEQQYSDTIAEIIKMRDESKVISADQANKLIAEATRQRDQTIKRAEDTHSSVVKEAKSQAGEHIGTVNWQTGEVLSKWEVLKNKTKVTLDLMGKETKLVWETMKTNATTKATQLVNSVTEKMNNVKTNIQTAWKKAENYLEGIDLAQIGRNIIQGLINGINATKDDLWNKAKEIANGIKSKIESALDIRSPSRVMMAIGEYTGQGLAIGLENSRKDVQKSTSNIIQDLIAMNNKIGTEMRKNGARFKEANDAQIEATKKWYDDKKYYNSLSLTDELKYFEYLVVLAKNNKEEKEKAEREVYRVKKEIHDKLKSLNEEYLTKINNANEKFLADQKRAEEDHVTKIRSIKAKLLDDEAKAKEDFLAKSKSINDKLIADENRLTEQYNNAVESRKNSLYSFAGIFDKITRDKVSGQDLLSNLSGQVDTFKDWQSNLTALSGRGLDQGLLEELQAMGPKAADEIAALNSLSDEELSTYVSLWQEKSSLAKNQSLAEMEGLKLETQAKIQQMRDTAAAELEMYRQEYVYKLHQLRIDADMQMQALKNEHNAYIKQLRIDAENEMNQYKTEWVQKIKEIRTGTEEEFDVMKANVSSIGKDTISGIIDGMNSMVGPLEQKAREIASIVQNTIKGALQIKSPSRVMRDQVGKWIPLGIAEGIEGNLGAIEIAADRMAKLAIPQIGGLNLGNGESSSNSNTYILQPGAVQISAKDIREFNHVVDFFNRIPQAIKAR